jgi:hypothetical protein
MLLKSNVIVNGEKIFCINHDNVDRAAITAAAIYYFGDDFKINFKVIANKAPIVLQLSKISRKITVEPTDYYYSKVIQEIDYCFKQNNKSYYFLLLHKDEDKSIVLQSPYCMSIVKYIMQMSNVLKFYHVRMILSEIEKNYIKICIENGQFINLADILIKEHNEMLKKFN